jgi:hypothetical protein
MVERSLLKSRALALWAVLLIVLGLLELYLSVGPLLGVPQIVHPYRLLHRVCDALVGVVLVSTGVITLVRPSLGRRAATIAILVWGSLSLLVFVESLTLSLR